MKPDRALNTYETATVTPAADVGALHISGGQIATLTGERRVQDLRPGDRVVTRENGLQPVRWIGRTHVKLNAYASHLRPILIRKGALVEDELGTCLPERDMLLSPNRRIVGAHHHSLVGCAFSDGFVLAKHLTGLAGVSVAHDEAVLYLQPFFAETQVVLINGVWVECLNPTDPERTFGTNAQLLETREIYQGFACESRV